MNNQIALPLPRVTSDRHAASLRQRYETIAMSAFIVTALLVGGAVVAALPIWPTNLFRDSQTAAAMATIAICLGYVAFVIGTMFKSRGAAAYMPLAESSDCVKALDLVRGSSIAAQIRDEIIATGRQLYVDDLRVMRLAVRLTFEANEVARKKKACAELHGLTDQA